MTVLDPAIPACPNCGSEEVSAEVLINHTISLDGEGGIDYINPSPDSFGSFERAECVACGHVMIEDGVIVDDAVTGTEVV